MFGAKLLQQINAILQAAYAQDVAQIELGARSLYFMVDSSIPPPGTAPTLTVQQAGSLPFLNWPAEELAQFLASSVSPTSPLSATDFVVIDATTMRTQMALYVRSKKSGALKSVRLALQDINDIPLAVLNGTLGFDEVQSEYSGAPGS